MKVFNVLVKNLKALTTELLMLKDSFIFAPNQTNINDVKCNKFNNRLRSEV